MSNKPLSPSPPDPRIRAKADAEGVWLDGWRCLSCRYELALPAPRCPRCHKEVVQWRYGPEGTVWSATVLRIPLPGRVPPTSLAYVDLDDGPRILAHVDESSRPLKVGERVRMNAISDEGDVLVGLVTEEQQK